MPVKRQEDDAAAPVVAPDEVALDEWVRGKSVSLGRRVEALNAFYRRAQRDGMGRSTRDAFDAAFAAFLSQPA